MAKAKRSPEWFRACREALGLTQEQLAEKLGMNKNSVYRKETAGASNSPVSARDETAMIALLKAAKKPVPA
mgnify:CR=1 FL=1